jgi:hypothetical protein
MFKSSVREITKADVQTFPLITNRERVPEATLDLPALVVQVYTLLGLLIGQ